MTGAAAPWDLIVVGGGSAGLPAALFAADRGARVLIVEAMAELGGTLWLSMGQMTAAGSRLQQAKGISDSADAHYADVMRQSRGTANPDLVRLAVDEAAETFDWLCGLGLEPLPEHPVQSSSHEPYGALRYYWGAEGGRSIRAVLAPRIERHVADGRIALRLSHRVVRLMLDDGAVTGVVAEDAQGVAHAFPGRNVALTSGGYSANPQMFEELSGSPQYSDGAYPGSQGDGHRLAVTAGGALRGAEHFIAGFGQVLASETYPSKTAARLSTFPERRAPWEIYVNARGERFVREDIPSVDARQHALLAQPDRRYWVVFDQAILDAAPPMAEGMSREQMSAVLNSGGPSFTRADSLEELARLAGIDPDGLARAVAGYNYGVETGHDFLGRVHNPLPIGAAPFYAIRQQGATITSVVGVTVDGGLRVVRADGTPIPNLYAAGEILGSSQTMGRTSCAGMMLTPALTFGRLLGQSIIPVEPRP